MLWVTPVLEIRFSPAFLLCVISASAAECYADPSEQTSAIKALVISLNPNCILTPNEIQEHRNKHFGRTKGDGNAIFTDVRPSPSFYVPTPRSPSPLHAPLESLGVHLAVGENIVKFQICWNNSKTWKMQTSCLVRPVFCQCDLTEPWAY